MPKDGLVAKRGTAGLASFLCSFLFLGFSSAGQAPEDILKAEIFLSRSKVLPGQILKIAVLAKIKRKWHIHANKVADEFLVPTSLTVEPGEGLEVEEIVFPKAKLGRYEYAETPLEVFDGEILIGAQLRAAPDLSPGPRRLKVKLRFQGCDDRGCLPPATIELPADVEAVSSGSPAAEDHPDIFKKIAFAKSK